MNKTNEYGERVGRGGRARGTEETTVGPPLGCS